VVFVLLINVSFRDSSSEQAELFLGNGSIVADLASAGLHRFFPKTSRRFLPLQPDRAIEQLRKTLEREPNFVVARWRLARAYAQKVMYQEAISELQNAIAVAGRRPYYVSLTGYVDALAGKRAEALKILNELLRLPQSRENLPAMIATVYVGLGRQGSGP